MKQPTLEFDVDPLATPVAVATTPEPVKEVLQLVTEEPKTVTPLAMPVADPTQETSVVPDIQSVASKATVPEKSAENLSADAPVFFEISSVADQAPVFSFETTSPAIEFTEPVKPVEKPAPAANPTHYNKDASAAPVSSTGGYLAKPVNIYVHEQTPPKPESNTNEELTPVQSIKQADEPVAEMQLVVKDSHQAAGEKPQTNVQQAQSIMMSKVEEPALQDETEDLRRRATDRIAKLRNLSFNINAADPNNEFETVPAYLRRNMELHSSIADVESFYSNYTVKSDDNNQAEISTINTFLDGKKPD